MFNIGPFELIVLALVAVIVVGPDRLPALARDAASMLKTLRELATGARNQLKDELGPEFADMDLRNLNPRTAVQRAVFGDDVDLGRLNPRNALRDAIFGDEDVRAADPRAVVRDAGSAVRQSARSTFSYDDLDIAPRVSMSKTAPSAGRTATSVSKAGPEMRGAGPQLGKATARPGESIGRPRPRPRPAAPSYDGDAT